MRATRLADDTAPPAASEGALCCAATRCTLERLMAVSFAPLVTTRPLDAREDDGVARLVLRAPRWGDAPPSVFSAAYLHAVAVVYLGATRDDSSLAAKLPWDLWTCILRQLDFDAFERVGGAM